MNRSVARSLLAAAAVVGMLVVAAPASAHVSVNPDEATEGSYARLVFRMPTESDTASTTKLEVHMPEEAPFGAVSTRPVPGWSVEVTRTELDEPVETGHGSVITEAVSVITWTADDEDAALAPGEFGEFAISLGPLPEMDQLVFRALQTYSDGNVVRWIELPEPDGSQPPLPAPVLTLRPADEAPDESEAGAPDAGAPAAGGADTGDAAGSDGGSAGVWLGLAGLVAGLAGLAMGGIAVIRTRR